MQDSSYLVGGAALHRARSGPASREDLSSPNTRRLVSEGRTGPRMSQDRSSFKGSFVLLKSKTSPPNAEEGGRWRSRELLPRGRTRHSKEQVASCQCPSGVLMQEVGKTHGQKASPSPND